MRQLFVSIIIPCRNEEKFIGKCLDSIIAQDYLKAQMEVLIVDGMSEDNTKEIVKEYIKKYPFIKLLDNPNKFTPFAFNIGVKNAKGEVIFLMGAHAKYEKDYISKCVKYLKEYDADNVGGIVKTSPQNKSLIAKSIAFSLNSSFAVGDAYYKSSYSEKPRWVDTVFGGCYKKKVFNPPPDGIGLFNEKLIRSQDVEFNIRLKRAGGKMILIPNIVIYYYPKNNLKDFFQHNFLDGIWATYPLKFIKTKFKLRHYIPLIFILTLPLSIWPYILLSLFFSLKIAIREKDIRLFFLIPLAFGARHFGYGLGSLWGLIKIIF